MDTEVSSTVVVVMLSTCGLSLAALFYLFQKHISGQSLLAYQSRRRVPWGARVALFAMSMPLLTVLVFFSHLISGEQPTTNDYSGNELLQMGWLDTAFKLLFVVSLMAGLVAYFRADAHDLGLPTSWKQLASDIGLGVLATLAAFLPIYAVQLTLVNLLEADTPHPLVEQLQEHPSTEMLVLGFVMAVIAAPLFEEFIFRGLLQGWLERREDEVLDFAETSRFPQVEVLDSTGELVTVAHNLTEAFDLPRDQADEMEEVVTNPRRPAQGWLSGLPHGWTPILLSGVVFGLAHLGHGVSPVPLVLFGIVLGYLYQRTHRLAPSITAHMVFNSYSMLLLWLQLAPPPTG